MYKSQKIFYPNFNFNYNCNFKIDKYNNYKIK